MSQSSAPPRSQRPSDRPSSRPVEPDFVTLVHDLWVRHDPMRFATEGAVPFHLYDHESYVTSLCADEFLSVVDAEQIVTKILRNEYGSLAATLADHEFLSRVQALAAELFAAAQQRVKRPSSVPTAGR
ncbi:MAG: hypothetical protein U0326_20465 [Polyangiales bacterium]